MSISDEKRYEFVTGQIRYFNDKILEAFELFLKLASAVVAGAAWIATQSLAPETKASIGFLVPWLMTGIGVSCIALIVINLRSWWGFRVAESALVGVDRVSSPRFPRSCSSEIVLAMLIFSSVLAPWLFNPF